MITQFRSAGLLIESPCLSTLPGVMLSRLPSLTRRFQSAERGLALSPVRCKSSWLELQRVFRCVSILAVWRVTIGQSLKRAERKGIQCWALWCTHVTGSSFAKTSTAFFLRVQPAKKLRRIPSLGPATLYLWNLHRSGIWGTRLKAFSKWISTT